MKKILISLLAISTLLTACTETWLEEERFDKVDTANLYNTEDGLKSALNGLYSIARRYFRFKDGDTEGNALQNGAYWFYCAHDLAQVRTYNEEQIYRGGMRPDALPTGNWNRPYMMIDRASAIIENTPKVNMTDSERHRIIAEARTMRAWAYMRLWTVYDNILLDTIPTTPENVFDAIEFKPATKEQVMEVMYRDLDYAIKHLQWRTTPGIASQGLARQLKAEVAMWNEDYAEAAAQCDAIIESGMHRLVDINQLFGDDLNHDETLFAFQFNELAGGAYNLSGGDGHHLAACFQARFYEIPFSGLSVSPIIEAANYGGNCYGWTYPNSYLRSLYDEANDKRFSAFFYPDVLYGNNPASEYYQKPVPGNPPYSNTLRQYAFSLKKYLDTDKRPNTALSYKPIIMYRLAQTYITGAEAHWRMGNNAKAIEYINKVRQRAGIADITSVDLQTIMDEHARELCFEGNRWFFLKRIGKLREQVNKYLMFGSNRKSLTHMTMKDYQVRWPIPQVQINAMGTFPQNTGYAGAE